MKHEPSRFLSDADSAGHFVGTDSVLAIRNHPHGNEPLVQRDWRILEDSPDLGAELFTCVLALALPQSASGEKADFLAATSGADDPLGPAPRDHELQAVLRIREMNDGLLECLGFF